MKRTYIKKKVYSRELGIDLGSGKESEIFKWFLACLLFGKPIQQEVAKRTYMKLAAEKLVSPKKILDAGWDKLVKVLDKGHYVRYDFSTATRLLEISGDLKEKYGTLEKLLNEAKDKKEAGQKHMEFKGVGPVTAGIFLRDPDIARYLKRHI